MSGLSQEELADNGRINRSHLGQIERGECHITILTLQRIAAALDTSLSALLRGID
jgi:transcriptional regulator with XRE-family HTH domain